jgi:hypothetical protein
MKAYKHHFWLVMASAFVALTVGTATAAPPLSGAIFTTDLDGVIVNGNTKYQTKCGPDFNPAGIDGVWLDGGPGPNAPATAAGLPDGDYYFQVTDPSGKKLLSTDPVKDRCVTVSGGFITDNCLVGPGTHNLRPSADNGVVVELCPFDDTPNNGGVYKAWMTPVGDYLGNPDNVDNPCHNGCFHGFIPAASKTDNFKTEDVDTFCIRVHKDVRDDKRDIGSGVGWEIWITDPIGGMSSYFTDKHGNVERCGLVPGDYDVEEHQMSGYTVVGTKVNGQAVAPTTTVTVKLSNSNKDHDATVEYLNEECDKCDE